MRYKAPKILTMSKKYGKFFKIRPTPSNVYATSSEATGGIARLET